MNKIFSGVRVLDLTKVFSGPFATRMLADYGAEVIKVENSLSPDDTRNFPPLKNNWSGYFEILNRNKKGVSLNLKNEIDLQKLYSLVKNCDVFVENFAPKTKFSLKIDYQTLRKINPEIIYASLSGRGQTSSEKYYDIIAQTQSGLLSLTGEERKPIKIGPAVVDAFSGMTLAFAISSALFYKQKTGQGQYIDVSMLASSYNLLESSLIQSSVTKTNPKRTGNQDGLIAPFGIYKTKDGFIAIAIGNQLFWKTFAGFLQKESSISIPWDKFSSNEARIQNQTKLTQIIETVFSRFETEYLVFALKALNLPVSKVNTMQDVLKNEFNYQENFLLRGKNEKAGEFVTTGFSVRFSEQKDYQIVNAPQIGENNKDYGI